jgi:hypothetical protein
VCLESFPFVYVIPFTWHLHDLGSQLERAGNRGLAPIAEMDTVVDRCLPEELVYESRCLVIDGFREGFYGLPRTVKIQWFKVA